MSHPEELCACDVCGAGGVLTMHSKCHPYDPTWAVLEGKLLTLGCAVCGQVICYFTVANGPHKDMPQ